MSTSIVEADRDLTNRVDGKGKHDLLKFFAATFFFSWMIYGAVSMMDIANNTTISRILLIAGFGPSLSAMLFSTFKNSNGMNRSLHRIPIIFIPILAFLIGIESMDHKLWEHRIDWSLLVTDAVLVLLATSVITWLIWYYKDLDRFQQKSNTGRGKLIWYAMALGLWPVLIVAGNSIAKLLDLSLPPKPTWPEVPFLIILPESFLWALVFGGPLNEEPGWRGFALPRLQSLTNPLNASLIIGLLWGLWHVPLHLMGFYYGGPLGAIIRVQEIPRAILFTWIYNRTKGNLFIMLLFHASINTTSYFMSRSYPIALLLCLSMAVFVVIYDRMWLRLS